MSTVSSPSSVFSTGAAAASTDDYPRLYWRSQVSVSALSADFEETNEPILNVLNPATNLRWRSTSSAAQYVRITFPSAEDADYLGLAAHNLGSGACAMQLQYSLDGSSWTDITSLMTPESQDGVLVLEFDTVFARYFRLKLVPTATPPSIGVIQLGLKTVLQRKIYVGHTPVTLGRETIIGNGRSESGQFLGRVQRREWFQCMIEQKHVTPSFYRTTIDPFVKHARTGAFFVAWRPQSYPNEKAYCWMMKDTQVSNQMGNGMMQFSLSMQGLI